MKRLLPGAFLAVLVLTVWPGVWLTHSLLRTYFPGYGSPDALWSPTWWWYIPLTALSVPLGMRSAMGKSRRTGAAEAGKLVEKIRAILDAGDEAGSDRAAAETAGRR